MENQIEQNQLQVRNELQMMKNNKVNSPNNLPKYYYSIDANDKEIGKDEIGDMEVIIDDTMVDENLLENEENFKISYPNQMPNQNNESGLQHY